MKVFGFEIGSKKQDWQAQAQAHLRASAPVEASNEYRYKPYPVYTERWDGERSFGELGFPLNYLPDFRNLSYRSWQAFYESDVTQTILGSYLLWVVGKGLTLNSEPADKYIKKKDPSFNRDAYTDDVEDMWQLFASSKYVSHNGMQSLHQIAHEAKKNAIISGDVLVVMRYDGFYPTVQLIDGLSVANPTSGKDHKTARANNRTIKHGVEVDSSGKHVAFYVLNTNGTTDRVEAYHPKTGRLMAWMVYGHKYRIDDTRGMPLFAVVLEELRKVSRYKDATLATAEENAKIAYSIEHDKDTTGQTPFTAAVRQAAGAGQATIPETQTTGDQIAMRLAMTTNKMAFNLPPGATIKSHRPEGTVNFGEFFNTNFDIICASLQISPEVALGKFNSNYSASRAAIKMTEHKIKVDRSEFAAAFYKPIYDFWLDTRILTSRLNIPGYLSALISKDREMLEAFRNAEFNGANMPHVDPVKEVNAERLKLGNGAVPLTTFERATRNLSEGDWYQNIDNVRQELEQAGRVIDLTASQQKKVKDTNPL